MNICTGIPGGSIHKVANPDDLVAGLCDECSDKLISAKSWGSSTPSELKANHSGVGIVLSEKHQEPKPRVKGGKPKVNAGNFTLPGSSSFTTPKPDKPKRKQPWGMERP